MATKRQMTHARLKMLTGVGVRPTHWPNQALAETCRPK